MKYFSLMTSNRVVGYGKLRSGASVPTSVFAVFRTEICRLRNVCLQTLLAPLHVGMGRGTPSLIFFPPQEGRQRGVLFFFIDFL